MSKTLVLTPLAGIHVQEVVRTNAGWIIASTGPGVGTCPSCGIASNVRHGSYRRSLQDLPVQGSPVTIELTVSRLSCLNQRCPRRTFAGLIPKAINLRARRTSRVSEIVRQLGYRTGGRPSERLLACFGMAVVVTWFCGTSSGLPHSWAAVPCAWWASMTSRGARARALGPSWSILNVGPVDRLRMLTPIGAQN